MAISLTTSVTKTANYQGITKMEFVLPHMVNPEDVNEIIINKDDVIVVFHVTTWDESGEELSVERHFAPFSGWSQLFLDDVKEVYSRLENYAITNGFIGAGTAEVLA